MVSTDPLSDMFTRIRNAIAVNKPTVSMPHSRVKEDVAKILVANGYLNAVKVSSGDRFKELEITINAEQQPATITEIKRVSTPGRREYAKTTKMPIVKHGRGIIVVSTSKGIMTGEQAQKQRLGGEVICEVY